MRCVRLGASSRIHVAHNISVTAGSRSAAEGVTAPSPMPRPRTRGGSAVLACRAPGAARLDAHRLARHLRGAEPEALFTAAIARLPTKSATLWSDWPMVCPVLRRRDRLPRRALPVTLAFLPTRFSACMVLHRAGHGA